MACKVETIMKKIAPSEYIDRSMLEAYIKQELRGGAKTSTTTEQRSKNAEAVKKLLVVKGGAKIKPSTTTTTEAKTAINIYAGTGENAELSNFAIRPFKYKEVPSVSVEQFFQDAKFKYVSDTEANRNIREKILNTSDGSELKKLGSQFKDLDTTAWNKAAEGIMAIGLVHSFEQNPEALKKLLATGDTELTHTQDKGKWGTKFPELLMKTREKLRNESVESVNTPTNEQYEEDLTEFAKEHGIDIKLRNDTNLAVKTIKGNATGAYYKNGVVYIPNYEAVLNSKKLLADLGITEGQVKAFVNKSKNWDNKTNMKVHEIWHALTVDYLDSWIGEDGKARANLTAKQKEAQETDRALEKLFEMAKKQMGTYNPSGAKSKDGKPYWHSNSREFLAVALAEPKMLEKLNTIKYEGDVTLAQKILSTLFKIIEAATGIKLDPESMAGELIRIADASAKNSPKSNKAYNQSSNAIMPGINGKAKLGIKLC